MSLYDELTGLAISDSERLFEIKAATERFLSVLRRSVVAHLSAPDDCVTFVAVDREGALGDDTGAVPTIAKGHDGVWVFALRFTFRRPASNAFGIATFRMSIRMEGEHVNVTFEQEFPFDRTTPDFGPFNEFVVSTLRDDYARTPSKHRIGFTR